MPSNQRGAIRTPADPGVWKIVYRPPELGSIKTVCAGGAARDREFRSMKMKKTGAPPCKHDGNPRLGGGCRCRFRGGSTGMPPDETQRNLDNSGWTCGRLHRVPPSVQ